MIDFFLKVEVPDYIRLGGLDLVGLDNIWFRSVRSA